MTLSRNRIIIFLVLSFLITAVHGCKDQKQQESSQPSGSLAKISVKAMRVTTEEIASSNEVAGTIEAIERATISAKVTGIIEEMPVTLGSTVKKGDLLLRIKAGEISARLTQAKTGLEQAKRNLEREKRLLAENAATRESVKSLEEAHQIAEAAYEEALTFLAYTTVTAPFSGLVAGKMANRGDLATAGTPLLELTDNTRLQAVFPIPESLLHRIRPGEELLVQVPATGIETAGTVKEIAPVADVRSRTAVVKVNMPAMDNLLPGQFVRVLLPGTAAISLFVPDQAVVHYGQLEKIFVVEDGHARMRLVRTGDHRQGQIEILSGLTPGEQVIVDHAAQLVDGQPVQVLK